jgi:hypothetical protein
MKRIYVLFVMIGFAAELMLAQTQDSTTAEQPAQPVVLPQTLPTQPLQSTVPVPPSPPAQIEQPEVVHPVVPATLDVKPEKKYSEDSTKAK